MIKIICVGKIKESYLRDAISDYQKRINKYHKFEIIEVANKIDKLFITNSNITFIIGGSDGLDDEVKNRSNYRLSFSSFTFPHQLFRVILLEQIYRCFKILNNETYHK